MIHAICTHSVKSMHSGLQPSCHDIRTLWLHIACSTRHYAITYVYVYVHTYTLYLARSSAESKYSFFSASLCMAGLSPPTTGMFLTTVSVGFSLPFLAASSSAREPSATAPAGNNHLPNWISSTFCHITYVCTFCMINFDCYTKLSGVHTYTVATFQYMYVINLRK